MFRFTRGWLSEDAAPRTSRLSFIFASLLLAVIIDDPITTDMSDAIGKPPRFSFF
jgi:hypothetical protein